MKIAFQLLTFIENDNYTNILKQLLLNYELLSEIYVLVGWELVAVFEVFIWGFRVVLPEYFSYPLPARLHYYQQITNVTVLVYKSGCINVTVLVTSWVAFIVYYFSYTTPTWSLN